MAKITVRPGFGLVPIVLEFQKVDLRNDCGRVGIDRKIEFERATPLEYLERWCCANEVFGDSVRLASVIEWADGMVSFAILQPQYDGSIPSPEDIHGYFDRYGWTWLKRERNRSIYFNYAFGVLAIDALPRNCYVSNGELLPFNVILCRQGRIWNLS